MRHISASVWFVNKWLHDRLSRRRRLVTTESGCFEIDFHGTFHCRALCPFVDCDYCDDSDAPTGNSRPSVSKCWGIFQRWVEASRSVIDESSMRRIDKTVGAISMVLWVQESSISIEVESGRKRRQMACPYLSKKLKDVSSTGWIFVHAGLGDLVKAEEGGGRGGREEERGRERKREEERGRERKGGEREFMKESAGHRWISFVKAARNVVDVGHFVLVATVTLLIRAPQYGGSLSRFLSFSLSLFLSFSWVLFFYYHYSPTSSSSSHSVDSASSYVSYGRWTWVNVSVTKSALIFVSDYIDSTFGQWIIMKVSPLLPASHANENHWLTTSL